MAILATVKEGMAVIKDIADIAGDVADFVGLSDLREIKQAIGGAATGTFKTMVTKKGTIKEFNDALAQLTVPEQDAIDEIIDALPVPEAEHFRINAVLTGDDLDATVRFLKAVAAKPDVNEAIAYLRREHYLAEPTVAVSFLRNIGDHSKKAAAAVKVAVTNGATATANTVVTGYQKVKDLDNDPRMQQFGTASAQTAQNATDRLAAYKIRRRS